MASPFFDELNSLFKFFDKKESLNQFIDGYFIFRKLVDVFFKPGLRNHNCKIALIKFKERIILQLLFLVDCFSGARVYMLRGAAIICEYFNFQFRHKGPYDLYGLPPHSLVANSLPK